MKHLRSIVVAAALALPATAQEPAGPGRYERVAAASDSTQQYALLLPAGWSPQRPWPVLLLADPSGRALLPLERFQAAAEQHGWVVLSGWGTLANTDSADAVTERALNAMLEDALGRWSGDRRAIYLAGFSGTARLLWPAAAAEPDWLGGLIVVGAGVPGHPLAWRPRLAEVPPFPVFTAAGLEDFNHDEVLATGEMLAELDFPHRVEEFDGGHTWLSPELAAEAVAWLELRAALRGRASRPAAWVDSVFAGRSAEAARLEAASDAPRAVRALRYLAEDFAGVRDTAGLAARAARLEADSWVRREAALRAEARAAELEFRQTLRGWLQRSGTLPTRRLGRDAERVLGLARLRRTAADSADLPRMRSARRQLALFRAWAAFSEPRRASRRGDHGRAAAWLDLARSVREDAAVCTALARARIQARQQRAAEEAMRCALRLGRDPAELTAEPLLRPLVEAALGGPERPLP